MNEKDDKLAKAASGLATDIAPGRDLWPGIEAAISRPKRARWTPMLAQAAAMVLLVATSSIVTYIAVRTDEVPGSVQVAPGNLVFEQAAFGGDYTLDSLYGRAGHNVESQLDLSLANLSPEARDDVLRNLAVIRQAITDISHALEEEPNSAFLQQLLVEAYGKELALMNRVGSMAQRVQARKDI